MNDTIAAISTATGPAALAMVRMSGPDSVQIAERFFQGKVRPSEMASHVLHYGSIVDGPGEMVDEVMLTVLKAPHSFTAEDMVEITCHGGSVIAGAVLEASLNAGARLAKPGEFTLRAFLNGRIDLAQAEAVCDIINARTRAAARAAMARLDGGLSRRLEGIRTRLLEALALMEAHIDFPEEDLPEADRASLAEQLNKAVSDLGELAETSRSASVLQNGAAVVLAGRPNVGKSSLFNMLLREERAIVAAQPGTTRDVIESWIEIKGIPVRLFDTAGLHEADGVERHGVDRALSKLEQADLVLLVLDLSQKLTEEDQKLLNECEPKNRLVLANKSDLPQIIVPETEWKMISAVTGQGLHQLEEAISERLLGTVGDCLEATANLRQAEDLSKARTVLVLASEGLATGKPLELAAADIGEAVGRLGAITGEAAGDEVLELIFSRFCIGK